jgi:hypothetical protein
MRGSENPGFSKLTSVEGRDLDLLKKTVESETPLTTADIDKHVESIVQVLRETKNHEDTRFLIDSLIQDEVLDLFMKELLKDPEVVKRFVFQERDGILSGEVRELFKLDYNVDIEKFLQSHPQAVHRAWENFKSKHGEHQGLPSTMKNLILFDKPEYRTVINRIQMALVECLKVRLVQEEDLSDIQVSSIDVVNKFITPDRPHIYEANSLENQTGIIRSDRVINVIEFTAASDIPRYEEAVKNF